MIIAELDEQVEVDVLSPRTYDKEVGEILKG